jgi:acetyl esterase/lipase
MSSTIRPAPTTVRRYAPVMVITVLALLLLVGPTPRADANPPFTLEVETGINYGGSPGTALDLYVPDFPGTAKRPLLIWTNGCAWLFACGRTGTQAIANEFNPKGYAVAGVSVAGTLFGNRRTFPTQLHDIRAAIRWLRGHAADYDIDPNRFAIMGFSSGGWTSVIAGTTSDEASLPGEPNTNGLSSGVSSAVQSAVGFSSPTDFLQMNQWYLDNGVTGVIDHDAPGSPESLLVGCAIQTCPAAVQAANPITYVEGDEVATLLLHGFVDPLVPHGQSELLYGALAAAGNEVTFISVDEAGHSPDQIRAGEDFTVFHTNRGGHETITNNPAPTWETIEHFIHVALSRARGG